MKVTHLAVSMLLAGMPLATGSAGWQDLLNAVPGGVPGLSSSTDGADQLSDADIGAGLREALSVGAERAVSGVRVVGNGRHDALRRRSPPPWR